MIFGTSFLYVDMTVLNNRKILHYKTSFFLVENLLRHNKLIVDNKKKFNNLFLVKNKYNFFNTELSFYNSSKEERINYRFLKTLIERSVDLLLIKKINHLYFVFKKQKGKMNLNKEQQLIFSLEKNQINIKKFYFQMFILKMKFFLNKLVNFDIENLNYFTKKSILTFCIFDVIEKKNLSRLNFFNFSFSLVFHKFNLNYFIFNCSNFFFFRTIDFFVKKTLVLTLTQLSFKRFQYVFLMKKRYLLLYLLYNKTFFKTFLFNVSGEKKLNLFLRNFSFLYNKFDLTENLSSNFIVSVKEQKINVYIERKINNYYLKIGLLDNLNFFFSIHKFTKINIFLKFSSQIQNFYFMNFFNKNLFNFKKLVFRNIKVPNNSSRKKKLKNVYLIKDNLLLNKKRIISFFFFYININLFLTLQCFDNFIFNVFNVEDLFLFKNQKIEKVPSFNLIRLFVFLKKNKNLLLERLNFEKMDQRTYYKKYFLKEKYKDLVSVFVRNLNFKKIYQKKNIFFENFRFFSDIFFKKYFNIKMVFKKEFFKKSEIDVFISKFFKNFSYFLFLSNRNFFFEYKYLFLNILLFFFNKQKNQNFFKNFDFFSFEDRKLLNSYNKFFKKLFFNFLSKKNNFLDFLVNSNPLGSSVKIFIKKYFNKKLNFSVSYFNFFINFQYKSLFILKNKQLINFFDVYNDFVRFNYYDFKKIFKFLKYFFFFRFNGQNLSNSIDLYSKKLVVNYVLFLKLQKIFSFSHIKNFNFFCLRYKIQYSFYKTNIFLFQFLNKILNLSFKHKDIINKEFFENVKLEKFSNNGLNFFSKYLIGFLNNVFKTKILDIDFQNFDFLINFDFYKQNFNTSLNSYSYSKKKINFRFIKNLIYIYLNYKFFIKKINLNKYKLNFFSITLRNSIIKKINNNLKIKINNIKIKLDLFIKIQFKNNLYLNSFLKFIYLKNFFHKKFLISYMKIVFNFINSFKKNFFLFNKTNNFLKFNNFNLQFYSFYFCLLKKKIQNKKNKIWLKINVTKRNVFINLFVNIKKPSVFVFTAGQTFFEGKLKKTKQAGMFMGRKIWKKVVFLSRKNFKYNDFFFFNFKKIFDIFTNQLYLKKNIFVKMDFLKSYLIVLKNILKKKKENKNKVYSLLKKNQFFLFTKNINMDFFSNFNKFQKFFKSKKIFYSINNTLNLSKYVINIKLFFLFNKDFNYHTFFYFKHVFKFISFKIMNYFLFKKNRRKKIIKKTIKKKKIKNIKYIKLNYKKSLNKVFNKVHYNIFFSTKKSLMFFKKLDKKFGLRKKVLLNFFFNLKIKLKTIIYNQFIFLKNFLFIKKRKNFFLIKRKFFKKISYYKNLNKRLRFVILLFIFLEKKKKFSPKFFYLRIKDKNITNFSNIMTNKKIFSVYRALLFSKFVLKNKKLKYLFNLNFFFLNFNFFFKIKNLSNLYKVEFNLKKKNLLGKKLNFFLKIKFYNYFLFNYKKIRILKMNNRTLKNFSFTKNKLDMLFVKMSVILKKLNYFLRKKLMLKFGKSHKLKNESYENERDLINFFFSFFQKLSSSFKNFDIKFWKLMDNFKIISSYKERKKKMYKLRKIRQIFFNDLRKAYSLVNFLIYSNFLYEGLVLKRKTEMKTKMKTGIKTHVREKRFVTFLNLFKKLKYLLLNILKEKFLDFKHYTYLYNNKFLFNRNYNNKFLFNRKKFNRKKCIYKKKKINYKKKFILNNFAKKLINLKKFNLKFKTKNLLIKRVSSFFFWKFLKIKFYKNFLRYSLFFKLRSIFMHIVINSYNNILNGKIFKLKTKKRNKFIKKKKQNLNFQIYKQRKSIWLENLKKKKLWLYYKIKKKKIFKLRYLTEKIGVKKIDNFFSTYSNLIFFFLKSRINVVKKIFFLNKFLKFYLLFLKKNTNKNFKKSTRRNNIYYIQTFRYKKLKRQEDKRKFFFKYFIKLFLRSVLCKKKILRFLIFKKLKKILKFFFIAFSKSLKFNRIFCYNSFYLFKNDCRKIKLLNCAFFSNLNFLLKKLNLKKIKNVKTCFINNYFILYNNFFFKKFINTFELFKNVNFFFNHNVRINYLVFNFIKILKLKRRLLTFNKYKILINCKNLKNYKKFFVNNFFIFFKFNMKKNFSFKDCFIRKYEKKKFINHYFSQFYKNLKHKKFVILNLKKIVLKYHVLFYVLKFYKYFSFGLNLNNVNNLLSITKFTKKVKNLINLFKIDVLKWLEKNNKLKSLKKIDFFLNINLRRNILPKMFFILNSVQKFNNISSVFNNIIKKNEIIKQKKFVMFNNFYFKRFNLNLLTTMVFINNFKNIIFNNLYLLNNKVNLSNFFSLKKFNKNIFKRWRKKYYSNFDNKFFVPKKGFLLIFCKKKNRIVRGIYKGFIQQARGKRLFKRLRPQFVKFRKFIFTRSRKVKGRRK